MNEGIFLDLMRRVQRGDMIRIYPMQQDNSQGIRTRAYPCKSGSGEIYEVTEPFEARMEAYNDVALRVRTENGLCLIINVEEIWKVDRIWPE
jgi:hypothetical protein